MTATSRDPYAVFLGTADAPTWRTCLDEVAARVDELPTGTSRAQALTQGLTIATYVIWLNSTSGDIAAAAYGREQYARLTATLSALPRDSGQESDTAWGVVLGGSGYGVHGLELLARHRRPSLEHRLLCMPRGDLQIVAALSQELAPAGGRPFLPAVHVYGSALVNVGAAAQARELVVRSGWPDTEPLLAAVLGRAAERTGDWPEAHARYRVSSWPEDRYRAALTGVIAGAGPQQLTLDQPLLDALGAVEDELDQTALIRLAAFLDACAWHPVGDWLVELEQGKLCFRRRWHSEADAHFAAALAAAPEQARYPLASLRFSNLTWLSGDAACGVRLGPEALTAGRAALALAPRGDDEGVQSLWLAREADDPSVIPAEFGHWPASRRAEAWAVLGDEARALDAYLTSLEQGYEHRTVTALVRRLAPAGFRAATEHLAELVLRESEDDFFALWETAEALQSWGGTAVGDGALEPGEDRISDRFRARLRALSLLELKNALRSSRLFRSAGSEDVAEELLVRTARSAESVSELLMVAVLCRPQDARAGRLGQLGYGCLVRAARESRDRFERLQIAHELFAYGRVASGRAVLEEEHALSDDALLSHAEAVVVLQCSPWLPADRIEAVAAAAVERLRRDGRSGVLGVHHRSYVDRLRATLSMHVPRLAAVADADLAPEHGEQQQTDPTPVPVADPAEDPGRGATEIAPADLDGSRSRGTRLASAVDLLGLVHDARAAVQAARPATSSEVEPVRLDLTGAGVRTVELGDLWRLRLTGGPLEQQWAAERLRAFSREEDELDARWEEELRLAAQRENRQLVEVCERSTASLDLVVGAEERTIQHPVVRGLYEALARDVERLRREVAETADTALRDLSVTPERLQHLEHST